jgi:hypothetical protein
MHVDQRFTPPAKSLLRLLKYSAAVLALAAAFVDTAQAALGPLGGSEPVAQVTSTVSTVTATATTTASDASTTVTGAVDTTTGTVSDATGVVGSTVTQTTDTVTTTGDSTVTSVDDTVGSLAPVIAPASGESLPQSAPEAVARTAAVAPPQTAASKPATDPAATPMRPPATSALVLPRGARANALPSERVRQSQAPPPTPPAGALPAPTDVMPFPAAASEHLDSVRRGQTAGSSSPKLPIPSAPFSLVESLLGGTGAGLPLLVGALLAALALVPIFGLGSRLRPFLDVFRPPDVLCQLERPG